MGLAFLLVTGPVSAQQRQILHGHVPAAVARLTPRGRMEQTKKLHLAIGLPPRNAAGLTQLLHDLYDPASPRFGQYITPAQFAEQFGPTDADYDALAQFAKTNGLKVVKTHANRLLLDVEGSVADIEKSLHVTMRTYQHPTEGRTFFAPDTDPSPAAPVTLLNISGLDDYSPPRPHFKAKSADAIKAAMAARKTPHAGSGPSGSYGGNDFRNAYVPGTTLTGAGQSVALVEFDTYYRSDITAYATQFGIRNVPLIVVDVNGGVSSPGNGVGEVSLDIEMAMAMAPGLTFIFVYQAPQNTPWVDVLSAMADDNNSKQLSCSWGGGPPNAAAEVIFQQMAAQGQSFFNATGDSDAYVGAIPFPSASPSITQVGATTLTTGSGGAFVSEKVWNWGLTGGQYLGSSGGSSPSYAIPSWQQGISMATNQGSTTQRNVPDVSMVGDAILVRTDNGDSQILGGTSCAAPLWAGFTALVNQQAAASGRPSMGFINPALYNIAKGASYSSNFHDTTTGDNKSASSPNKFSAVAGYDLCTGWGTPMGATLIHSLAGPFVPTITGLTPGGGARGSSVVITGTDLYGATSVTINGVAASFTVNSLTQITATVPATATTGLVRVTTPGGTATSAATYYVGVTFNPTAAIPGNSVVLTGYGFTGASAVKFNGVTASFTVNSNNQITTTVPAGATTGPVTVTTTAGVVTSYSTFTVLTGDGKPTLDSFTPGSGAVLSSVTINGANFANVTSVSFNGAAAIFTVNSQNQISATVPVPAGTATGPITVTTALGSVTSSTAFTTLPTPAAFSAATDVPITASGYNATGINLNLSLNYAPTTGTSLTVLNNTGPAFIQGVFANLAQGQTVTLGYHGQTFRFIANYYGGTGNDLVLQWADTRLMAWGYNGYDQIGNNSTTNSILPVAVLSSGAALSGKTVLSIDAGGSHSLAVCSDGAVAAWGRNDVGQLGNGSTPINSTPVAVKTTGTALQGNTVISAQAGYDHSLALCSNGTVVTWGANSSGQLGNNTTTPSTVAVAVSTAAGSALANKTVTMVSAGYQYSLALCSDGTVASWGYNSSGQLGINSTNNSLQPATVNQSAALTGKTVTMVSAGKSHALALCSDGSMVSWGYNGSGQLGTNSGASSSVPVAVFSSIPLSGKTVIAVAAGSAHSLALCSDGTVLAWGSNGFGQVGNNSSSNALVPAAVNTTQGVSALSGKKVIAIAAGDSHSLALCSDGTVAAWGTNSNGELGNNSAITKSLVPIAVNTSNFTAGEAFTRVTSGMNAGHSVALVAAPPLPPPVVTTLAAASITSTTAQLNGTVNPKGASVTASFQYGTTTGYGMKTDDGFLGSGTSDVSTSITLVGLSPHTTYHFALNAAVPSAGSVTGNDMTFTTLNHMPVANGDMVNNVTGAVVIPVLENDTDADGDTLTITSVGQGMFGSVTNNGTSVTYTPGASFSASDLFFYTISDGFGGTASSAVTIQAPPYIPWRAQWFGQDAGNPAIAGDNADPNHNGIPNLMEYALNGIPLVNGGPSIAPTTSLSAGNALQLNFSHYLDRTDITLIVQAADAPNGPWTDLASSTAGGAFTVLTSGATVNESGTGNARAVSVGDVYPVNDPAHPRRFMRLKVTRP